MACALVFGACIAREGDCGENQVQADSNYHECVCAPGHVLSARGYGCKPCGLHEEVVQGECRCEQGYAAAAEGEPCEELSGSAFGVGRQSAEDCAPPNPYCAHRGG